MNHGYTSCFDGTDPPPSIRQTWEWERLYETRRAEVESLAATPAWWERDGIDLGLDALCAALAAYVEGDQGALAKAAESIITEESERLADADYLARYGR